MGKKSNKILRELNGTHYTSDEELKRWRKLYVVGAEDSNDLHKGSRNQRGGYTQRWG